MKKDNLILQDFEMLQVEIVKERQTMVIQGVHNTRALKHLSENWLTILTQKE